jgi:2-polyprenyl-3-methyl-5-hydroxy-6-metoxy-1,4-benzoquinol methylase
MALLPRLNPVNVHAATHVWIPAMLSAIGVATFVIERILGSSSIGALFEPRRREAAGAAGAKFEAAIDRFFVAALPDGRPRAELLRSKLRNDPVSRVALGALDGARSLLDVGGGVGALALAACAAGDLDKAVVLDWDERKLGRGRRIATRLGAPVEYHCQDVFDPQLPRHAADVVLCIDVLHYADLATQRRLVDQLAAGLPPGGRLVIRDMNADLPLRTACTVVEERVALMIGRTRAGKVVPRSGAELTEQLQGAGLTVDVQPCYGWFPFSNTLWVAQRPA